MPRYKVTTPATPRVSPGALSADFEQATERRTTEGCAELMRPHGFEGCCVWRHDTAHHHWRLIFDTGLADENRMLSGSQYWLNVAQNELARAS